MTKRICNATPTDLEWLAAQSLWRSKSWLGMTFRKLKSQKGPQKAITAMAHRGLPQPTPSVVASLKGTNIRWTR
jgi:hypothetical protein